MAPENLAHGDAAQQPDDASDPGEHPAVNKSGDRRLFLQPLDPHIGLVHVVVKAICQLLDGDEGSIDGLTVMGQGHLQAGHLHHGLGEPCQGFLGTGESAFNPAESGIQVGCRHFTAFADSVCQSMLSLTQRSRRIRARRIAFIKIFISLKI